MPLTEKIMMEPTLDHWNDVYRQPLGGIPWEISVPPKELVALLSDCLIDPTACALDVACGTGNYARYIASRGYSVTGVDVSATALEIARSRDIATGIQVEYILGDATKLSSVLAEDRQFNLILDYSLLHHLASDAFARHAMQFASRLEASGRLLVVCYSDTDPYSRGRTTARGTLGNEMYYRSRTCIEAAYLPLRVISYAETTLGKHNHHRGHCFVFGH